MLKSFISSQIKQLPETSIFVFHISDNNMNNLLLQLVLQSLMSFATDHIPVHILLKIITEVVLLILILPWFNIGEYFEKLEIRSRNDAFY